MKKIMVVGSGTMGSGIAQALAQAGNEIVLRDIEQNYVDKGLATISKNLNRLVKKEKITLETKAEIEGRITGSLNLEDGKDADLVIEAIVENIEAKKKFLVN